MKKKTKVRSDSGNVSGDAGGSSMTPPPGGPRDLSVPPASTQKFLLVPIPRCATRRELLDAVEKALETHDLPFFDNHNKVATGPAPESIPGDCPRAGNGMGPGEGLVIFMKQEGWPNS